MGLLNIRARQRYTPNADPAQQHIRIVGQPDGPNTPDLETLVRQHIGDQTIRKNAVRAVEFLLTASPEYFRPDDPGRAGHYEPLLRLSHVQQFTPPVQHEKQWERVSRYLTCERRLPSAAVDALHQQGLIYADDKQNLVSIRMT